MERLSLAQALASKFWGHVQIQIQILGTKFKFWGHNTK